MGGENGDAVDGICGDGEDARHQAFAKAHVCLLQSPRGPEEQGEVMDIDEEAEFGQGDNREALELLVEAIKVSGYEGRAKYF